VKRPLIILGAALALVGCDIPSSQLTWHQPTLTHPADVDASCAEPWRTATLDPGRDYIVHLPASGPLPCPLTIGGGHNIVVFAGEVAIPWQNDVGHEKAANHYGLYLAHNTGEVYIEGVKVGGPDIGTPVVLNEDRGGSVTLQNLRITARGHGYDHPAQYDRYHADCVQTWNGPKVLRVDGLTCDTDNFGFQFQPMQYRGPAPDLFDIRHVNIFATGSPDSTRYMLWRVGDWPIVFQGVILHQAPGRDCNWGFAWPSCAAWPPIILGDKIPAPYGSGDFVGTAGIGYTGL
jgi:hypothetical protein